MTRVSWRRSALAAAAVLAAGSLSACGGGDDPDAAESQPPASAISPSGSASESASTSASQASEPEPYLPVPDGVQLTPPGSELTVEQSAVVAWEPRQEVVGVLDLTVNRLERTSFAESFQGWQLDDATRATSPYFVRAAVTNTGVSELGGREIPLYAVDTAGTLIQASRFQAKFEPCPGNGVFPKRFAPGASREVCLVYLVPGDGTLTAVSFRPDQDFDPITWTGEIQQVPKDEPKKSQKKPNRS